MKNISAIIPNFNYASLLERRIKSVVNQSISPNEILFLDDCSDDNSVKIAEYLLNQSDIPFQIFQNSANQGVFKQWLKGINLAKYDYIWIAEADDYCENNFLETMLEAFNDEKVVLAYCRSQFDDQLENVKGKYLDYISRYFDYSRWRENYKENAIKEVENYLCCINTIPNASAVVFDKKLIDISKISLIENYYFNGDWLFYILCLSSNTDNKIAYVNKPLNHFYRHEKSIFSNGDCSTRPISEFLNIVLFVLENFTISQDTKKIMLKSIIGNLLYWPLDENSNDIISKIMQHLPLESAHMIYNKESQQIINLFKRKLDIYENRIQERDERISILENKNIMCRINQIFNSLPSQLCRIKKIFSEL